MLMSLSAFAGGEWVFTDPPITQNPDGSVVRNPAASIKGDWTSGRVLHGTTTPTSLPERLPGMGSREAMLDYIVASNNMAMNVHISLLVEQPSRQELMTGRWSNGFRSYRECLDDIRNGMSFVLERFSTNKIPATSLVYAIVYVTYFNDNVTNQDRGNGLALSIYNPVDRFDRINLDKIMGAIEIDDDIGYGQVIVRVPVLDWIVMKVEVQPGLIAEMSWTKAMGAQPSSLWQQYSKREWTTPTYLYLRNWYADGSKPTRISLRKASGGVRSTYTQYGDNLENVQLGLSATSLDVLSPRGATVTVYGSTDLNTWTPLTDLQTSSNGASLVLGQPRPHHMFFRGEAK